MTTLAHRHVRQAIALAVTAYALYSSGDAIAKLMRDYYAPGPILLFNGLFLCLASTLWLMRTHPVSTLWTTPLLKLHLLRSAIVGLLSYMAMTALHLIPLSDFYGIIFLSPFFVVIMAKLLFRELIGWHRMFAILCGFVGVLLLAQPHFSNPNAGYMISFLMVFVIAAHVLTVRRLAGKSPLPLLSFYPGLGMVILGLPLVYAHPQMPTLEHLPYFITYATTLLVGQVLFAMAFARTPVTAIVAPFVYTQMLWGIFYGYILFGHIPSSLTVAGAAIVMASGVFMIIMDAQIHARHLLGAGHAKNKDQAPAQNPAQI